jgi:hypothetical protein
MDGKALAFRRFALSSLQGVQGEISVVTHRSYNGKRDKAEPAIVEALQAAGYDVFRQMRVDLAVRKSYWEPGVVMLLEAKTPQGKKGRIAIDKRQKAQIEFLAKTGVPRVSTPATALSAVRGIVVEGDSR